MHKMKYAIYIRFNTATDNENVSITNQVTLFENFMKKNGIELYKIYSDIAGGSTLEREGIQQLMTDAKKKKFEGVIVQDLTRISRLGHLTQLVTDVLNTNQIKLITLSELNTDNYPTLAGFINDTSNTSVMDYIHLNSKRCAIYVRTPKDSSEHLISNQINQLNKLADVLKLEIDSIYIDEGSGSELNREGLQKLMSDAHDKKFDVVLVQGLSRVSRNAATTKQFINLLNTNEIELLSFDAQKIQFLNDMFEHSSNLPIMEDGRHV